jgi:hypothetical protein
MYEKAPWMKPKLKLCTSGVVLKRYLYQQLGEPGTKVGYAIYGLIWNGYYWKVRRP